MGYATTWCAVPVGARGELLRHLELRIADGVPGGGASDAVGVSLGQWYVVHAEEHDWPRLRDSVVRSISAQADLLICRVEEHVMASSVEFWSRGARKWAVSYLGEHGIGELSSTGSPPNELDTIRADCEAAQREDDQDGGEVDHMFDVPLRLAESITGYRHDSGVSEHADALVENK